MTYVPVMTRFEEAQANMLTAKAYKDKQSWFAKALALWQKHPTIQKVWKFVESAKTYAAKFIRIGSKRGYNRRSDSIEWRDGVLPFADGVKQFYLIRLMDKNGKMIWAKIGTTERATEKRMGEHLRNFKKNGVVKVIVDRVWNCGDMIPDYYESAFRAYFMRVQGYKAFVKNDRFLNEFDLTEADRLFDEWRA